MKTSINIFLAAFALLLSSCGNSHGDYDASGIFETTEVIVSAQANGEILQLNINEGAEVKPDVPLGYIDTIQLYLKKKQLLASNKSVISRQKDVPKQIAGIKQQIATQKREQERFRNLVKLNAANQKQVDDITAQLSYLEKELAAQTENLEKSNKGIYEESSSLEIQMEQLNDQIRKSVIASPIKGTVLAKYAEQGELAVTGKALFKVADIENMYLRAYITASQLTELKVGQEVTVFADSGEKDRKEYKGVVTWISDKAEFTPKTIQTRDERANLVYAVKIAVKNDGYIKRGMYGEIKLK